MKHAETHRPDKAQNTYGEKIPGCIVRVRDVPVRLHEQAAHATRFGYFPISSVGFYSYYGRPTPSEADLELRAREEDHERSKALRRIREAKAHKARTPEDRFSAFVELEAAISRAMGYAFLAPPPDQDKLLREVATATDALKPFFEPGYARPFNPGSGWSEAELVTRAQEFHDLCARTCRLLPRLCQRPAVVDAWATLVDSLPKNPGLVILVPGVVKAAIARRVGEPTPPKPPAQLQAPTPAAAGPTCAKSRPLRVAVTDKAPIAVVVAATQVLHAIDKRGQYSLF